MRTLNYFLLFVCLFINNFAFAQEDRESRIRLPKSDVHGQEVAPYIETVPDADYVHASAEAYERFRDIKYSIRIIWGVYCMQEIEASWPMLNYSNEKKQEYQELYKKFNPVDFNAEQWMTDFDRWGMQAFAFICKHHDGFSMWHTKTKVKQRYNYLTQQFEDCDLHYSIEETPFKRDIVKELCDAARKHNIKVDLYFSHPDWYDADFRPYNYHPLSTPDMVQNPKNYYTRHGSNKRKTILTPDRTPEETARMMKRHREQMDELLSNYGNVDMMCLDQWFGKDNWQDLKETMKFLRKKHPDVMFRARGIGNYGDYYQPEQFIPKDAEKTEMPWMSICLLSKQFSYDPKPENYKGAKWVIHNLIDCVAKGGSFMVCLGPDQTGKFHPKAVEQLDEVGRWLKINGEGIYETRSRDVWKEGDVWFTRSKDSKKVYAFVTKYPDGKLTIKNVVPKPNSAVRMFGVETPLKWSMTDEGVVIDVPASQPCDHAWGFAFDAADELPVTLQQRTGETLTVTKRVENWQPEETAVIVCDMWDKHWCSKATARWVPLSEEIESFLNAARNKGIHIVHAPSDCMKFYKDYPQRQEAEKVLTRFGSIGKVNASGLATEKGFSFPLDASDDGCECTPKCKVSTAWTRQTDKITIAPQDIISDSGNEIGAYFKAKGIKNVILTGVATNMCVMNRPFGLRAMKHFGFNAVVMRDLTDVMYNPAMPPKVDHFSGQDLMLEYIESRVCPSMSSTDITGEKEFKFPDDKRKYSREEVMKDRARGIVLPKNDVHYNMTKTYVEDEPDSDYIHASEKAHEDFRDIKFSVRIIWGVYSKWGIEASWPMLNMPYEKRMEYNNLYKTFNPTEFDADEWMNFFTRSGAQAFAFITKHTDGFSLFHTKTRVKRRMNYLDLEHVIEECDLAYSIEETPFKRDIVKELCDAARKTDLKIDLYYPHSDWYDADFRPYDYHPLTTPAIQANPEDFGYRKAPKNKILVPDPTPEERAHMIARHREQIRELLTNYGKIDMMCLDEYMGRDSWSELKKTVKLMREWQPDLMIRNRGIGNYGDYYQPEQVVPGGKENTNMPWMSICLLGKIFAYDPVAENYKGAPWVIHNLIDCVAKGGSFMVCFGPDETGKFHPKAVEQLEEVGRWLKVNGEGIYATRPCNTFKSGDFYFTRGKDKKRYYAFTEKWFGSDVAGNELTIPHVGTTKNSVVRLLGYDKPLQWKPIQGGGLKVEIPDDLKAPCKYAWGFEITQ